MLRPPTPVLQDQASEESLFAMSVNMDGTMLRLTVRRGEEGDHAVDRFIATHRLAPGVRPSLVVALSDMMLG